VEPALLAGEVALEGRQEPERGRIEPGRVPALHDDVTPVMRERSGGPFEVGGALRTDVAAKAEGRLLVVQGEIDGRFALLHEVRLIAPSLRQEIGPLEGSYGDLGLRL
jgi:hypothetical protein